MILQRILFIFFVYIFIYISANDLIGLKFSQMILHTEVN